MKINTTSRIVFTALFAALCCVATLVIAIPSPTGYVNLGDGFVLLSAFILGPVYGAIAAGVGTALADLLCGYAIYAPATLIVKGLMGLAAGLIFRSLTGKKFCDHSIVPSLAAGIVGEAIMVLGYFLYESLVLGAGAAAAASVPGNVAQGICGVAVSTVLIVVLMKIKYLNPIIRGLQSGHSVQ
jgi:uncharacterized membrane protein